MEHRSIQVSRKAKTTEVQRQERAMHEHHDAYLGKRVKRGLFRTATGILINADVNGSHDIMVKAFPEAMQLAGGDTRCALHLLGLILSSEE